MQTFSTMSLGYHRLGDHRGNPRLYISGANASRAGFNPGEKFSVKTDAERSMMTLEVCEAGVRTVSRKMRGEKETPVIDINSSELTKLFEGFNTVRVIMQKGKIFVLPTATDIKKKERLERLQQTLASGEPILVGSVSHGGGVLSHAIHHGLQKAGLPTRLAFANDIRSDLLDQASENNDAWDEKTQFLAAPLQELVFDDYIMSKLPKVHILEGGIPCSGASVAGRAKKATECAEAHEGVGHLVHSFLALIAKVAPAIVLLENVPAYASTGSMWIIRHQLRDLGYVVHETTVDGAEWNALEHRKRMTMVAVTQGLDFDFKSLVLPEKVEMKLGDVLEDIPEDDPRWSEMLGLKAKQVRDMEANKGFKMQIVKPDSTSIPTLTKGYAKVRSTDPKLLHNSNPDLLRQITPVEHARCKNIPEKLIKGLANTTAHELLGQSIIYSPFVAIGSLIGQTILNCTEAKAPAQLEMLMAA